MLQKKLLKYIIEFVTDSSDLLTDRGDKFPDFLDSGMITEKDIFHSVVNFYIALGNCQY